MATKAGAPRKYKTAKALRLAVERYFDSITREVTVTEKKDSGQRDENGHVIYEDVPVINKLGEEVIVTEYIVPPTVQGIAEFLGIHRSTWDNYCDPDKHPEFFDTTTRARGRMRAWREEQILTRPGKDVKGIIFDLQNNFGMTDRREIELGPNAAKAFSGGLSADEREELLSLLATEIENDDQQTAD